MKLYEYQAKEVFRSLGIPTPGYFLLRDPSEAEKYPQADLPSVIKAQVLVGGRGKAGGVQFSSSRKDLLEKVRRMFQTKVKGCPVKAVLMEEKISVSRELYLGISIDYSRGAIVALASPEGGVEIEETARLHPERVARSEVDIRSGLRAAESARLAAALGLEGNVRKQAVEILKKLYDLFVRCDALLVEINPLALTAEQELVALDARLEIDDEAKFRHPEFSYPDGALTPLEAEARKHGLIYVELDGDVGVIGNGAGLNMATLDILARVGLKPANFLEVGGRTYSLAEEAVKIVCARPRLRAVFGNFYGCISRNDVIAEGLAGAIRKKLLPVPMIVAMRGNGAEAGRVILREAGVEVFEDDEPAAHRLAELLKNQ